MPTIDDYKQALQDNQDALPGLLDDLEASMRAKQKCFDNINWLTAKIAELENPTPVEEPDVSVPDKQTFVDAIKASKAQVIQPTPIEKKVAG